jgi:hypothetical protein
MKGTVGCVSFCLPGRQEMEKKKEEIGREAESGRKRRSDQRHKQAQQRHEMGEKHHGRVLHQDRQDRRVQGAEGDKARLRLCVQSMQEQNGNGDGGNGR